MGRDPEGLQKDLRPSPLSDLQVQVRGLSDDNQVRFQRLAHGPRRDSFKALFLYNSRNTDPPGKFLPGVLREKCSRRSHACKGAFHVRRAAPVKHTVPDLSAERIPGPCIRILYRHCVHMSVEHNRRSRPGSLYDAGHVSVFVRVNLVVSVLQEELLQQQGDASFLSGIRPRPYQVPAQIQHKLFSLFA